MGSKLLSKKHKLKLEWEVRHKLKWPQVKITKKRNSKTFENITSVKSSAVILDYEAHHIIPINAGGINIWCNISPLTNKNHHLLHESMEEKACFSHDWLHRKFVRFILKLQNVFLHFFGSYINKKGANYAS